jgi:superfamily I DNA/RNA helicase
MPRLIRPELWLPIGVKALEPSALDAVREQTNGLVVAGPGAGKTELLAQRACYLLQTGACRPPRQILAISFKTDAAANLRDRVRRRCGEELSKRFHSLTFDGFAKSILDRFGRALPEEYRPAPDYDINFDIQKRTQVLLDDLVGSRYGLSMAEVPGIGVEDFYRREFLGRALPIPVAEPISLKNRAAAALWHMLLKGGKKSQLNFHMIGRLAELLVRHNPLILKALRQTYSHVFLDEFQDTTRIQYALTRTLFWNSDTVLTAVGDSKQRIMAWAGAMEGIFDVYRSDFRAVQHDLVMNFRSAPRLVRIQETLVAAIEPGTTTPQPADDGSGGDGECRVLLYPDQEREAVHLAELMVNWVFGERIDPREICVLTRNKPAEYTDALIRECGKRGVKARVETELQDLLAEPLALVALDALRLAVLGRDRGAWSGLTRLLRELRGYDESDPRVRQLERDLTIRCRKLGEKLATADLDQAALTKLIAGFFDFVDSRAFRRMFPQYLQGAYLRTQFLALVTHLWKSFEAAGDWAQALAEATGDGAVPIITVHKSKGLEYHTVVFMGLEDSAMWKFAKESDEEKRNFFVAFSRAKKRVFFTFCDKRARAGGSAVAQSRKSIGALYDLLAAAGVTPEVVP